LLPWSKLRERVSVHINFPRPLQEVERTSKWQQGFPRGEVRKCVSKSGLERSPGGAYPLDGLGHFNLFEELYSSTLICM